MKLIPVLILIPNLLLPRLAIAEPPQKPASAVSKLDQPLHTLLPGMSSMLTLYGNRLETADGARIVRGGKAQADWKVELGASGPGILSANVHAPKAAPAGDYALEVHAGGAWVPSTATWKVVAPHPAPVKPDPRKLPGASALHANSPAIVELGKKLGAKFEESLRTAGLPHGLKIPPRAVAPSQGHPSLPKDMNMLTAMGISDLEFAPRSVGALGGLLHVTGKGLDHVDSIKLGDRALELVTREDSSIVARFPSGVETLQGTLALVHGVQGVTLESHYQVVDSWARFQPGLEARLVPYAPSSLPVGDGHHPFIGGTYFLLYSLTQVPGTRLSVRASSGFEKVEPDLGGALTVDFNEVSNQFAGLVTGSQIKLALHASDPATGLSKDFVLDVPAEGQARVTYTIDHTSDLKPYWKWEKAATWGVTEGVSETPAGSVDVGMLDVGNDLAFRIASGPIGTSVAWRSMLTAMNNGWTVESLEWTESVQFPKGDVPKARAESADKDRANVGGGPFVPGNTATSPIQDLFFAHASNTDVVLLRPYDKQPSDDYIWRRLMTGFDLSDPEAPNISEFAPSTMNWLLSMEVSLNAQATLVNDHRVTVRLERVVLKGPPGADWHQAFGAAFSQEDELLKSMPPRLLR